MEHSPGIQHQLSSFSFRFYFLNGHFLDGLFVSISDRQTFIGLFNGSIYFNLSGGTNPNVYTYRLTLIFFTLLACLSRHQQDIPVQMKQRIIFYRERGAGCVSPIAFWLCEQIVCLPFNLINVLLLIIPLYYMTGLKNTQEAFGFFLLVTWLTDYVGMHIAHLLTNVSPDAQTAMNLFPVSLFFASAFAGYIVYLPEFPDWLGDWAPYLTFTRFSFQALVLNEFEGNSNLPDEKEYVDLLGFNTISKQDCAAILVVFVPIYAIAGFLALRYINFERR